MQERMGQESSDAYVLTLRPSKVWDLTNSMVCHALFTMVSLVEEELHLDSVFRFYYTIPYYTLLCLIEYWTKLYYAE